MNCPLHAAPNARMGFTLVELMVVLVIISILSSLSLAAISNARQRSKISKTRSTIRKINDFVIPQFDGHASRRVPPNVTPGANAVSKTVLARRTLQVFEMPDSWQDVALSGTSPVLTSGSIPSFAWNGTTKSYGSFRGSLLASATTTYVSSECLFMIICRSGWNAEALESFRTDEVGDIDKDNAPEFLDGWGRPIRFIRWAPGFTPYSLIQTTATHDPLDPLKVTNDYALIPLVYSSGPDGASAAAAQDGYGISEPPITGWSGLSTISGTSPLMFTTNPATSPVPGSRESSEADDNITNHSPL